MIEINLAAHSEKLAPTNPLGLRQPPLYHQMRTYEALADHPLVVNTYSTGTGKTRGALLGLLRPELEQTNCLFIAPTNELLRQHENDITEFLDEQGIDRHLIRVTADDLRALNSDRGFERAGERLNRLFNNPQDYGWDGWKPLLVVVNPDIFYYALYVSAYNPHDRRNLLQQFLGRFDYVIIDEFHYYSPKQLANFLFFFVICQQWGYFASGRRLCLLSATPDVKVRQYLTEVFPDPKQIAWISPESEPAESVNYPTTAALAPIRLEIIADTIDGFVASSLQREMLARWLASGRDGALISNALWRINQAKARLTGSPFEGRVRRLTGAETADARRTASLAPLLLATPTVDIGYNFSKPGKSRQPLDFVVFDARTRDEFIQRLGRAGRVLGRTETDIPSQGVALLPEGVADHSELNALNGQTVSRGALRRVVDEALPPRHDLYAYLRSYAVLEAFRPIFELSGTMRPDLHQYIDQLFEGVTKVFSPHRRYRSFRGLSWRMRRHRKLVDIVWGRQHEKLDEFTEEFVEWLCPDPASSDARQIYSHKLARSPTNRRKLLLPWAEAEYWQTEALFSFRDAFQGPVTWVYDPKHLLSDADLTYYDALHVAANFEADFFPDADTFRSACGIEPPRGELYDLYCHLRALRPPQQRLRLGLVYHPPKNFAGGREEWERLYCQRPIALKGLQLQAGVTPLDPTLKDFFRERHIPCLIMLPRDKGRLLYLLRDRNVFAHPLRVTCTEGTDTEYLAIMGTNAFVVHAELETYLAWQQRNSSGSAIIL